MTRSTCLPSVAFDFLVEFEPLPEGTHADHYFGLHEALEPHAEALAELSQLGELRRGQRGHATSLPRPAAGQAPT